MVGVVAGVGDGVDDAMVGHRVTVDPTMHCGRCAYCRRGLVGLCEDGGYMGMTVDGALAERLVVPAGSVVPLDEAVTDEAATVLEPVVVALRLLERTSGLLPDPVGSVVIGAGPLGIVLATVLRDAGHRVVVFELQPGRRAAAEALGLRALTPGATAPTPSLDLPEGPRLIVDTSASSTGAQLAQRLVTRASALAVVGRSPEAVPLADVLLGELAVVGIRGGAGHYPQAVTLLAGTALDPAAVISHRVPFDDAPAAFAEASTNPDVVLRTLIRFS